MTDREQLDIDLIPRNIVRRRIQAADEHVMAGYRDAEAMHAKLSGMGVPERNPAGHRYTLMARLAWWAMKLDMQHTRTLTQLQQKIDVLENGRRTRTRQRGALQEPNV